jgi:hypothetical protein
MKGLRFCLAVSGSILAFASGAQGIAVTAQTSLASTLRPVQNTYRYMTQNGANFFELEGDQTVTASATPAFQLGMAFSVRPKWSAVANVGWNAYRSQIRTTRVASGLLESSEDYQTVYIPLSFGLRWAPVKALALEGKAGADLLGSGAQFALEAHVPLAPSHSLFAGLLHARTWEYINTTTADPPNYRLFYSGYTSPFGSWHAQVGYRFALDVVGAGSRPDKTRGIRVF